MPKQDVFSFLHRADTVFSRIRIIYVICFVCYYLCILVLFTFHHKIINIVPCIVV